MVGRVLRYEKLRDLREFTSKCGQLVETRKRLSAQTKAQKKLGTGDLFAQIDHDLKRLLDHQITALERKLEQAKPADDPDANCCHFAIGATKRSGR